jgi:hypothetical protein
MPVQTKKKLTILFNTSDRENLGVIYESSYIGRRIWNKNQ